MPLTIFWPMTTQGIPQRQAPQHGGGADGDADRDTNDQKEHKRYQKNCHIRVPPLYLPGCPGPFSATCSAICRRDSSAI